MYRRIVLAFDSTVAGRSTLREGALLAKRCGAEVFLLSVVADSSGVALVEGFQAGVTDMHLETHRAILKEGLAKLEELGSRRSAGWCAAIPPSRSAISPAK